MKGCGSKSLNYIPIKLESGVTKDRMAFLYRIGDLKYLHILGKCV